MKIRHCCIALLLGLAAMAACSPSVKVVELVETTSPELSAIDSLMWRQPDSALQCLLTCRDAMLASPNTPDGDTMETHAMRLYNGHYYQLLLAELLYKNDYVQTNRAELQQVVAYFDSLTLTMNDTPHASRRHCGHDPQSPNRNDNIVFLSARAHYINGVGVYEQGDVVNACAEYLKTLEVMEAHFEERELVGHKARFLAYTYNRLGDLFSEQFMMESAITCYENALVYCKIEPTSPIGVSNILYRIGKQYDKKNEVEIAQSYFSEALENMAETDNTVYRDIVASKALCDYQINGTAKQSLDELNRILFQAKTENERLNRYLTIGGVFFYEDNYDSALYYLEPVFKNHEAGLQDQAANYLYIVYDKSGNKEQLDSLVHFMTSRKKQVGEDKALVSSLEDMFKNYSNQKLKRQAEVEREESVKKVTSVIIPTAVVVLLVVVCVLMLRNKKQLKIQQEEADRILGETEQAHEKELRLWQAEADKTLEETKNKYEEELRQLKAETEQQLEDVERRHRQWIAEAKERHEEELRAQRDLSEKEIEKTKKRHEEELEASRLAYQKEREALRQNLRQREEQVNALETAMVQQREEAARRREAFLKEPICQHINELLHGRHITTRDTSFKHEAIALKEEDYKQLKEAVERHYAGFDNALLSRCPSLRHSDLALCHLHLMGLGEGEIAALRSRTYSGIKKQNESLQEKLGVKGSMAELVLRVAEGLCGNQIDTQIDAIDETRPQKSGWILDKNDRLVQESGMKNMQKSMQKIVMLISASPDITLSEMASQLGMSRNGVDKNIRKLKEQGIVRRVGPDKGGHWEVIR